MRSTSGDAKRCGNAVENCLLFQDRYVGEVLQRQAVDEPYKCRMDHGEVYTRVMTAQQQVVAENGETPYRR